MIHALALAGAIGLAPAKPRPWVDVGTRRLFRCLPEDSGVSLPGYCDMLRVPLDWGDPVAGTIAVRFEWIPASRPGATGTIVAQEGGPGAPSTGNGNAYARLFGPLLHDRNLLLMDERGTGGSTPIDCAPLQAVVANNIVGEAFQRSVAACGVQLDRTFPVGNGHGYVHASELFTTTQSIRDLAAILDALELSKVDLYGDSYGTFFAQAFAAEQPAKLRSLVLDSAYPLDQNIFDAPARDEIRFAFEHVCSRSVSCAGAAPGSSIARIRRLARRLSAAPLAAGARSYDESDLADVLQAASDDTPMLEYRELDAAARGWLDRGDAVPLIRLFDRSSAADQSPKLFTVYSAGMEIAVECTVYQNPFDMRAPIAERLRQYRAAVAALPPKMFDPISGPDSPSTGPMGFDQCLRWPAPTHEMRLGTTRMPLVPPALPVLIISGELDSTTAPGDAEQARSELGPSAHIVSIPNVGHGPSLYDHFDCAQRIVRAFIGSPDASIDTSCTARIPEIHAVGVFPLTLADQPPATRLAGDRASRSEARLAALAVEALGDAIESSRYAAFNGHICTRFVVCGRGLRGGEFAASFDAALVTLRNYAYSRDTTVTGFAGIADQLIFDGEGSVSARLHVRTNDGKLAEDLVARWEERTHHARATIDGVTRDGRMIHEEMPAP